MDPFTACEVEKVPYLLPAEAAEVPLSNRYMIFCHFLAKMATGDAVLKRLEQKGAEADQIIEYLKQQVALLKEKAILKATLREEKKL